MKAIFVNLICINWTPVYLRTQKLIPKRSWLDKFHCSNIYPWHQPTHCHSATSITYLPMAPVHTLPLSYQYKIFTHGTSPHIATLLLVYNIYPWHQPTHFHSATSIQYLPMTPVHTLPLSYQYSTASYHLFIHFYIHILLVMIYRYLPMTPAHTLPLSYQNNIFTHGTSPHIATQLPE